MLRKLSRYKNQILSCVFALVMVFGGICSFSFDSVASSTSENNYIFPSSKPSVTQTSGYIEILYNDTYFGKGLVVEVYPWFVGNEDDLVNPVTVDASVNLETDYVTLFFDYEQYGSYTVLRYDTSGTCLVYGSSVFADSGDYINIGFPGVYEIVSVRFYGAYGNIDCPTMEAFSVSYEGDNFTPYETYANMLNELQLINSNLGGKLDEIITQLYDIEYWLQDGFDNIYNYLANSLEYYLSTQEQQLYDIESLLNEIKKLNEDEVSWLEKIWNSIQEFLNPDDEDKQTTDELEENSKKQSDQLNDLNKQNQTEKLDPSTSSGSIDANVDTDSMLNYGIVLQVLTNHDYVLRSLLLVVSVGLVGYVLFGKKK